LLAQSGLLNGRRATTHWKLLESMQATFPAIRVEGGPLYIQDGPSGHPAASAPVST
jgi:transcriptional regulator GlxA family with amidase domain